ncbi:MAG: hypothetical protein HY329_23590 [Chloroflexi bacterium]|nr:hypothetical protein [Chloroflexota bacterium]
MPLFDLNTARAILENLALLLLATALASVLSRRLASAIALLAVQGILLTAVAGLVAFTIGGAHAFLAVGLTLLVKVIAVPGILVVALREVRTRREVEAVLSKRLALLAAIGLVLVAYYVAGPLAAADGFRTRNALPTAMSVMLIGLFNMMTRKKALSQVAGLVAMENGLYLGAVVATQGLPLAVELGVAIDLLVGVLVMGVVARQIHRTFDTINTDLLRSLRG